MIGYVKKDLQTLVSFNVHCNFKAIFLSEFSQWILQISHEKDSRELVTSRGSFRYFSSLDTLYSFLVACGFKDISINFVNPLTDLELDLLS